jgi:hypothetical protein
MRWLWALPAVLAGGLVGVAALVVHRQAVWVGGWPLPWGVLLSVAAPTAVGLALRPRPALLLGFLFGWALLVLSALGDGPGGDFLLMSDVLGWGFLGTTLVLITVVLLLGVAATHRDREEALTP